MLKHLIMLCGAAAAFAASGVMLAQAGVPPPWMMLFAMFCFLGLARFLEPLYQLKVPQPVRRLRPWETPGVVYRALGVRSFGKLLRRTPLRALNATVYVSHGRDARAIRTQAESAEAIHFWAAALLLPYMAFCALSRQWTALGCFMVVQIVGNVYPILHLRLVRGRLDRMIAGSRRAATPMATAPYAEGPA